MRHKPRPHQKRQDGFRPEQKPGGRDFRPHAKSGGDRPKRHDFKASPNERETGAQEGAVKNHPFRQDRHDRKPNKPHSKHFRPHAKSGDDRPKRPDFKTTHGEREMASPEGAAKNISRPFRQDKFRHDRKPHGKHFRPHEKNRDARPRRPEIQVQREGVLLWGTHAVRAAWLNEKRRCIRLWVTEGAAGAFAKTISEAKLEGYKRPDPKRAGRDELDMLTPPGSVHQGIVLEAAALPEPALHEVLTTDNPPDLVLVLDQVTDPHNVGAIARSAAAFGVGGIIMTERNAPGLTGVLAKSASGAIEHVPLIHIVNLARAIEELQQAGYWCVGLAEEAPRDLSQCDLTGRTALVLGAEGEGLRQLTRKKCDELARLPTGGPIGSLNVSNAAAVALYEVRRQKNKF